MKIKKSMYVMFNVLILFTMVIGTALAEDGLIFRKNVSKTPDKETEKSGVFMMDFYVPAQASDGQPYPTDEDASIPYFLADGTVPIDYANRLYAKPLVSAYIDGYPMSHFYEEEGDLGNTIDGGIVLGAFDAYVSISLDDGTTWRNENLSRSADLSSFNLQDGTAYPGGVHAVVHQVAEDKILFVWASKYCQSGYPLYSLDPAETEAAAYLGDLEANWGKNAMYLYDLFGVAGNQGSVNYTEMGWPEVGEVPYSCIWTARGKLLPGDDLKTDEFVEAVHVVWTKPERLTSGVRDANLPAVDCAKNAGCALTWQEDPEGLRPGQGLGPGEGWSGAIANSKTDIWYSYITFADFDYVVNDDGDGVTEPGEAMLVEDYEALMGSEMVMPKPYVPMAMPVRLTDNDQCKGLNETDPYCWIDFDNIADWNISNVVTNLDNLAQSAESDFCTTTYSWTNPGGTTLPICITDNGRYMFGRVGATRVRMIIKPYTPPGAPDHDLDGVPDASAWLSLAAEETKALGTTDMDDTVDPVDIGKNMFYYSFDYAKPYNLHVNTTVDADVNPALDEDDPYVVQQGGMINQPAVCSPWFLTYDGLNPDIVCNENDFFGVMEDPVTLYPYYLTEIARRFALTLNNIGNITNTEINESGLAGMLIYKQGVIWQGGPADIMLRRLVVPEDFDATVDNPFAFKNMVCEDPDPANGDAYSVDGWIYTDGSNPNYLEGLCMEPAINITASTIKTCTTGTGNDACAEDFPVADDGTIYEEMENFPKVLEWRQCDPAASIEGCEDDTDVDDQSWENPFDVAKGHRGFLYGDYVMMMYAWSPNWQSNRVGNDHYNLYQRRSFDGGITWTTTPSDWCGPVDGLCGAGLDALDYNYGETIGDYVPVLYTYAAGDFEQGRNLSLLTGNKVTILDPRYSPGGGLKQYSTIRTDWLTANGFSFTDLPYEDDLAIDPSKYFMVYETGDNTTVAVGEATPLDLYYSRATVFGDMYEWFDYANDEEDCNPVDGEIGDMSACIQPRWPWLENATADLSGEASVVFNPGGTFAYNVWNQWQEEIYYDEYGIEHENIFDADMIFRRLLWLPDTSTQELLPLASIIYQSDTAALWIDETELTFAGTARDLDKLGDSEIVAYEWSSNLDGVLGTDRVMKVLVNDLSVGMHTMTFRAMDAEGHWSPPARTYLLVGDAYFSMGIPILVK